MNPLAKLYPEKILKVWVEISYATSKSQAVSEAELATGTAKRHMKRTLLGRIGRPPHRMALSPGCLYLQNSSPREPAYHHSWTWKKILPLKQSGKLESVIKKLILITSLKKWKGKTYLLFGACRFNRRIERHCCHAVGLKELYSRPTVTNRNLQSQKDNNLILLIVPREGLVILNPYVKI